ncbi:MAG: hypothetical protein QM783_00975 [Phycisphaerales bacterium]
MADEQAATVSGGGEVVTTTLNRPWLAKMVIFVVVLGAFGLWGLYDAMIAYPNRGATHAEYAQWQYLQTAKNAGKLNSAAEGIKDPRARLDELSSKTRSDLEVVEYDWLTALSRLGRLKEAATPLENPNQKVDELTKKWSGISAKPVPLEYYDLPFQWSVAVVCFGLAAWVSVTVLRSAAKKYRWAPATQTLTLAEGREVRAADLADVDKRKWHKYFCSLVLTDGSVYELDVLKYTGLEDWVLELEQIRFPERAEQPEEQPASEGAPSNQQSAAETSTEVDGQGPGLAQ